MQLQLIEFNTWVILVLGKVVYIDTTAPSYYSVQHSFEGSVQFVELSESFLISSVDDNLLNSRALLVVQQTNVVSKAAHFS
jgi:hypothetical protein